MELSTLILPNSTFLPSPLEAAPRAPPSITFSTRVSNHKMFSLEAEGLCADFPLEDAPPEFLVVLIERKELKTGTIDVILRARPSNDP